MMILVGSNKLSSSVRVLPNPQCVRSLSGTSQPTQQCWAHEKSHKRPPDVYAISKSLYSSMQESSRNGDPESSSKAPFKQDKGDFGEGSRVWLVGLNKSLYYMLLWH